MGILLYLWSLVVVKDPGLQELDLVHLFLFRRGYFLDHFGCL
jgi:hypothetical protein